MNSIRGNKVENTIICGPNMSFRCGGRGCLSEIVRCSMALQAGPIYDSEKIRCSGS